MILLEYGTNQMYLTISEMNTINNPLYYISITDETTKITKDVNIIDTSLYATRYNQFQIDVFDDIILEDLDNGIVQLNVGKHLYNVYSYVLAKDGGKEVLLCETGILQVNKGLGKFPIITYSDSMPLSTTYSSYSDRM